MALMYVKLITQIFGSAHGAWSAIMIGELLSRGGDFWLYGMNKTYDVVEILEGTIEVDHKVG